MANTLLLRLLPLALAAAGATALAKPPAVGEQAPDFSLSSLQGKTVRLSGITAAGPVVLVVLRGFPGYQCPYCSRQVQDFAQQAGGFAEAKARVVFVYPGPAENLQTRAEELVAGKQLPEHYEVALDPGYGFTELYGLRWNAPQETAYPATFLIDARGVVSFARV
ncbi:MAG: AhpC/TSA family protein, partial [Acidobacteria bacterium]|nr:AhpC/TSA family protein [Acidobacteriota bacterium]